MRRLSFVAALLLAGCGQNAILELTLDLPPAPSSAEEWFATVQPRTSENPFEEDWPPDELPPITLGPSAMQDAVSVVTEDTSLDVHLKVRFCRSPDCTALADATSPEVWYLLQHPFYEGKRTSFHIEIGEVPMGRPAAAVVVDRCRIGGCLTGTSTMFCTLDGRHVCED